VAVVVLSVIGMGFEYPNFGEESHDPEHAPSSVESTCANRRVVVHRIRVRILRELDLDLHRLQIAQHHRSGPEILNIPLTSFSTFILLMSSLLMVLALAATQRGDTRWERIWLGGTVAFRADFSLRPGLRVHQLLSRGHGAHDQPVLAIVLRAGRISRRARGDWRAVAVVLLVAAMTGKLGKSRAMSIELADSTGTSSISCGSLFSHWSI